MPSPYPPDRKAAVLARLEANGWNVSLTNQETGIPLRTLYQWRLHKWQQLQQLQQHTPSPAVAANFATASTNANDEFHPLPEFGEGDGGRGSESEPTPESDIAALSQLRRHILDELVSMSADLERGLKLTSPYQKVLILTQLLDRLMKLDEHLKPYTSLEDNVIRIEYVNYDGTIHPVPPWHVEPQTDEEMLEHKRQLRAKMEAMESGLLDTGDPDW